VPRAVDVTFTKITGRTWRTGGRKWNGGGMVCRGVQSLTPWLEPSFSLFD